MLFTQLRKKEDNNFLSRKTWVRLIQYSFTVMVHVPASVCSSEFVPLTFCSQRHWTSHSPLWASVSSSVRWWPLIYPKKRTNKIKHRENSRTWHFLNYEALYWTSLERNSKWDPTLAYVTSVLRHFSSLQGNTVGPGNWFWKGLYTSSCILLGLGPVQNSRKSSGWQTESHSS